MAVLHRLVTRKERASREAGEAARRAIQALPDDALPAFDRVLILKHLARVTVPPETRSLWPGGFVMLSLAQIGRVWDAIRALPARERPQDVRRAFDLVLLHLVPDEGRVNLFRDEFAEKMGVAPKHASSALAVLVRLGVLRRELVRAAGVRGPGVAVFYVNPHVAWNGALDVRQAEAVKRPGPLLKLMEQGAQ